MSLIRGIVKGAAPLEGSSKTHREPSSHARFALVQSKRKSYTNCSNVRYVNL